MQSEIARLQKRIARLHQALLTNVSPEAKMIRIRALMLSLLEAVLDAERDGTPTDPEWTTFLGLVAKANQHNRKMINPQQRTQAEVLSRRIDAVTHT